jgi:hypothetical protein
LIRRAGSMWHMQACRGERRRDWGRTGLGEILRTDFLAKTLAPQSYGTPFISHIETQTALNSENPAKLTDDHKLVFHF